MTWMKSSLKCPSNLKMRQWKTQRRQRRAVPLCMDCEFRLLWAGIRRRSIVSTLLVSWTRTSTRWGKTSRRMTQPREMEDERMKEEEKQKLKERKKERKRWVGKLKKRSKELKGRARFIYKLTPDNDRLTESRRDRFTIRNIISTFTLADRSCHSTLMRSSSSCYFVSCKDESSVAMVLCQWAIYTRKSQPATPIQYTIYLYILV